MRFIITGGGTGGHIYPAIAIADELKSRMEDVEILFVGSEIGMEKDIVPESGYEIELISSDGFGRSLKNNVIAARRVMKGRRQARELVREFDPDAVIGTGGYASAPIVSAAERMDIPTYIHEQNAIPGRTNRFLGKKARKIFLGFSRAGSYFGDPEKHVLTGNPVRMEFTEADREGARRKLGVDEGDFVLLAFGGSQGAGRLNREMVHVIESHREDESFNLFLGTGSYYYEAVKSELSDKGIEPGGKIHLMEYIDDMASVLMASDLVISRSGALTVAEVTACGVPAIFVPFPEAMENHQFYNALSVAGAGGAMVIEEKDLDRDRLNREITALRDDPVRLNDMKDKCASCGTTEAAGRICDEILADLESTEEDGRSKRKKAQKKKASD